MKKIFMLAIALLLVCIISLPAFAAEEVSGGAPVGENSYSEAAPLLTDEDYQRREDAYNEILALSKKDQAILDVKMVHHSELILVAIADGHEKEYAQKFIKQYGSFVVVTNDIAAAESASPELGGLTTGGGPDNSFNNLWIWLVFGIILTGTTFLVLLRRRRCIAALQASNGTVIAQNTTISAKETISAVKKSETVPGDKVLDSILRKIDKNNE